MQAGRYDVVVVGGGHNGLVAAAYLARAGRSVLLLERLAHVGGAAVSEAVFPGVDVRLSKYSYLVSLLPDQIVSDLGLSVRLADRDYASYTPFARDGRDLGLLVERPDGPATRASFAEVTGSDAEYDAWHEFYGRIAVLAGDLAPTLLEPLTGPEELLRRLREPSTFAALRDLPLGELVGRWFKDDVVAGVVLTDGLVGTFADVHADDGRAAACFLYHLIGNGSGQWRVPIGGMGAVTASMASAALHFGADVRTDANATSVAVDASGGEVGWVDGSGVEHTVGAGAVVSAVSPSVLAGLRGGAGAVPRPVGAQVKVNMVLRRLPRFRSGIDPAVALSGTMHVAESATQLAAAYADALAGRLPDPLPFEVYCHSLADPSILGPAERAAGYHTLTLFAMQTPVGLFDADNDARRAEAAQLAVAGLDAVLAEPLSDCLARDADGELCLQAATPVDLENSIGMTGGNIFHGDLSWPWAAEKSQVGRWGVETDEPRLVHANAGGALRGGGVSGIGGHNAAMALLA
ncbi:MAG: NAD(P)/FAD-dependent oxidoreductase [Geodermatophilaceae bacterium]|nr:NAD(P)/FAD-dependent oxidoreductase [Geodermatophilaceae bacterium]